MLLVENIVILLTFRRFIELNVACYGVRDLWMQWLTVMCNTTVAYQSVHLYLAGRPTVDLSR